MMVLYHIARLAVLRDVKYRSCAWVCSSIFSALKKCVSKSVFLVALLLITPALGLNAQDYSALDSDVGLVLVESGPSISPGDADQYYSSLCPDAARPVSDCDASTQGELDPLVVAKARNLEFDAVHIFGYLRNSVDTVPQFGVHGGAKKVVIENSGTPFDIAQAYLGMLRAADQLQGTSYNPEYIYGTVTYTQLDLASWLGTTSLTESAEVLTAGGYPVSVNSSGISILSIWVEAMIEGERVTLDPAVKPYLRSAGLDIDGLAPTELGSLSVSVEQSFSRSGNEITMSSQSLSSGLDNVRAAVEQRLMDDHRGARSDVLFGRRSVARSRILHDDISSFSVEPSELGRWQTVPTIYNARLVLQCPGSVDGVYFSDETVGKLITIDCEDEFVRVIADHPYAMSEGEYQDRSLIRQSSQATIAASWGRTSKRLGEWVSSIQARSEFNTVVQSNAGLGFSFGVHQSELLDAADRLMSVRYITHHSFTFLYARQEQIQKECVQGLGCSETGWLSGSLSGFQRFSVTTPQGTQTGIVQGSWGGGGSSSLANPANTNLSNERLLFVDMATSASAVRIGNQVSEEGATMLVASITNIVESYLAKSHYNAVRWVDPISLMTTEQIDLGGERRYFEATAQNWTLTTASLTNYSPAFVEALDGVFNKYPDLTLLLPAKGGVEVEGTEVRQENWDVDGDLIIEVSYPESDMSAVVAFNADSSRSGLLAFRHKSGLLIKGGVGVSLSEAEGPQPEVPELPKPGTESGAFSALSVDGTSGELRFSAEPDIVDGAGAFPYSLSLQRSFVSGDFEERGFGSGWNHNWDHRVVLSSDGSALFGGHGVHGAAAFAAYLVAISRENDRAHSKTEALIVGLDMAKWLVAQTEDNVAKVRSGLSGTQMFVKQVSGDFVSVDFDDSKLLVNGETEDSFINRKQYSKIEITHISANGEKREFAQVNRGVGEDYQRSAYHQRLAARPEFHMTTWEMPSGIVIETKFEIINEDGFPSLLSVENNVGAKIYLSSFDGGNSGSLPYCDDDFLYFTDARPMSRGYSDSNGNETKYHQSVNYFFYYPGRIFGIGEENAVFENYIEGQTQGMCAASISSPNFEVSYQRADWRGKLLAVESPEQMATTYVYSEVGGRPTYPINTMGPIPLFDWLSGELLEVRSKQGAFSSNDISEFNSLVDPDLQFFWGGDYGVQSIKAIDSLLQNTYFSSSYMSSVQNLLGEQSRSFYDEYAQPILSVDPLGRELKRKYDPLGRLIRVTQPGGQSVETEFDELNRVVETRAIASDFVSDAEGTECSSANVNECLVTTIEYLSCDDVNRAWCMKPITVTAPNGGRTDYLYTPHGAPGYGQIERISQPEDEENARPVYEFEYDVLGRLLRSIDASGRVVKRTYNTVSDPALANASGELSSVIVDPNGLAITTKYSYNNVGDIVSIEDARSNSTGIAYDRERRLRSIETADPDGEGPLEEQRSLVFYDDRGFTNYLATWKTGDDWLVTVNDLDKLGRPVRSARPKLQNLSAENLVPLIVQASDDYSVSVYDPAGRLTLAADPEGRAIKREYYADGFIKSIHMGWEYTPSGEVEGSDFIETNLIQTYSSSEYNENGSITGISNARGHKTSYTYDTFGRAARTIYPDGSFVEFIAYDELGNVTERKNRAGESLSFEYDRLGRLIRRVLPDRAESFGYDLSGLRKCADVWERLFDPVVCGGGASDNSVLSSYDAAGRLESETSVRGNHALTVGFSYDPVGNRIEIKWPDQYVVKYDYDGLNRLAFVRQSDDAILAAYKYHQTGRVESISYGGSEILFGATSKTSLEWEDNGDMKTLSHYFLSPSNPSHSSANFVFDYDKSGKMTLQHGPESWLSSPSEVGTDTYEAANELDQTDSVNDIPLQFDQKGNRLGFGDLTTLHDSENRLSSATYSGGSERYSYDANGRRVAREVNGVVRQFVHAGAMEIADYIEGVDGSLQMSARYIPGAGVDQRVAMILPDDSISYYHANYQGSVQALASASGDIVDLYVYSPFGVEAPLTTSGNPFRYTGRRFDAGTELYYYRARYYDAELGSFLQTDPLGYADQMNLYSYVANDPLNATDPMGMERVLAPSKDDNFLHKFVRGIARPVEGVGINAQFATAQALGVQKELRGFAANALILGAEFAKQEPVDTAKMLIDGYVDKGLIENAGTMVSNAIMTGKFKGASGLGGKTVLAGNLAQNVSGGVLASLDDAYDTLTSAGISPSLLGDDSLAAIGVLALGQSSFYYNAETNILTATYSADGATIEYDIQFREK